MTRDDLTGRSPDPASPTGAPGTALARATLALRSDPAPVGVVPDDLTDSVMGRVRGLVRGGRELVVHAPDGAAVHDARGSQVRVAERVLRTVVRQTSTTPDLAPDAVRVVVDDATHRVDLAIRVAARYGAPLAPRADELRARLLVLLDDVLGPSPAPRRVEIEVVDVTTGDPALG